jgi:hypothetical protein
MRPCRVALGVRRRLNVWSASSAMLRVSLSKSKSSVPVTPPAWTRPPAGATGDKGELKLSRSKSLTMLLAYSGASPVETGAVHRIWGEVAAGGVRWMSGASGPVGTVPGNRSADSSRRGSRLSNRILRRCGGCSRAARRCRLRVGWRSSSWSSRVCWRTCSRDLVISANMVMTSGAAASPAGDRWKSKTVGRQGADRQVHGRTPARAPGWTPDDWVAALSVVHRP